MMQFRYELFFLSNFYEAWFTCPNGTEVPTVEHAFQACKTDDMAARQWVLDSPSPKVAKLRGRHVPLRHNWEQVKLSTMRGLVWLKFSQNKALANKLLATGDTELVEGNYWGDTYWGVDIRSGKGHNHLGKILMEVRDRLRQGKR